MNVVQVKFSVGAVPQVSQVKFGNTVDMVFQPLCIQEMGRFVFLKLPEFLAKRFENILQGAGLI
jgi:hypothetical protein